MSSKTQEQASHTPPKVSIGTTWPGSNGRTWIVVDNLGFGRWRVATTDRARVGEMYTPAILTELNGAQQG